MQILEEYLLEENIISSVKLQEAKNNLFANDLIRTLHQKYEIDSNIIAKCIAKIFDLQYQKLLSIDYDKIINFINTEIITKNILSLNDIIKLEIIPLSLKNNCLKIAIANTNKLYHVAEISNNISIISTDIIIISDKSLLQILNILRQDTKDIVVDNNLENLLQQIFLMVEKKHASDVHIEPLKQNYQIRMRCDGLLIHVLNLEYSIAFKLISSLKILAKLDIAEKRLPQDGNLYYNSKDIRISTCPSLHGEKVVLRILYHDTILKLNELGLLAQQQQQLSYSLKQSQGLILITGPTGSGKTTTLYAILSYLNCISKNICSAEDPVEIDFDNINQVNINHKITLNFATTLRAFLRQDPDIIMVGEIRDEETAQVSLSFSDCRQK